MPTKKSSADTPKESKARADRVRPGTKTVKAGKSAKKVKKPAGKKAGPSDTLVTPAQTVVPEPDAKQPYAVAVPSAPETSPLNVPQRKRLGNIMRAVLIGLLALETGLFVAGRIERQVKLNPVQVIGQRGGMPDSAGRFWGPGQIRIDRQNDRVCLVDGNFHKVIVWNKKHGEHLIDITQMQAGSEQFLPINADYDGKGNLYVLDKLHAQVYVFSKTFKLRSSWPVPPPHEIAVTPKGRIYIAVGGLKSVAVFNAKGKELRRFAEEKLKDPGFMATDRSGNLFIVDRGAKKVLVYSPLGKLKASWDLPFNPTGNPDIDVTDDYVYLSEHDNNRVVVYTPEGKLRWDFKLDHPTVFGVDQNRQIYVVGPRGVHQFSITRMPMSFSLSPQTLGAYIRSQLLEKWIYLPSQGEKTPVAVFPTFGYAYVSIWRGLGWFAWTVLAGLLGLWLNTFLTWKKTVHACRQLIAAVRQLTWKNISRFIFRNPLLEKFFESPAYRRAKKYLIMLAALLVAGGQGVLFFVHVGWGIVISSVGILVFLVAVVNYKKLQQRFAWMGDKGKAGLKVVWPKIWALTKKSAKAVVAYVFLAVILWIFITAGRQGVNYGKQWDEKYFFDGLKTCVENLAFWPQAYYYGGMYFSIGYLALAPDLKKDGKKFIDELKSKEPPRPFVEKYYTSLDEMKEQLKKRIDDGKFRLSVLYLLINLTSTAILLMFFLVRNQKHSYVEAVIAAALLGLSWEFNYHSRHIAIDSMMLVFATAVMCFTLRGFHADTADRRRISYNLAAVGVGMALGSKVGGVLLVTPLLLSALLTAPRDWQGASTWLGKGWIALRKVLGLLMVVLVTYFITTPGFFLDPIRVWADWARGAFEYANHYYPGYPYYVTRSQHFAKIVVYFATTVLSHHIPISLTLAGFAVVGMISQFMESKRRFFILAIFPVIYFLFIGTGKLFIARNYQMIIPFYVIFVARGLYAFLYGVRKSKLLVTAGVLLIGFIFYANAQWLFYSASTVKYIDMNAAIKKLSIYVAEHPGQKFVFSPELRKEVAQRDVKLGNVVANPDAADLVAFFYREHYPTIWFANRVRWVKATLTSMDVNYDYYPTWEGNNTNTRIVIMTMKRAKEMNAEFMPKLVNAAGSAPAQMPPEETKDKE